MQFQVLKYENQRNIDKHKIPLIEAQLLFDQPLLIKQDGRFQSQEKRYIAYGMLEGKLMCVAYSEIDLNRIKIISFRKANKREKDCYKQYKKEK